MFIWQSRGVWRDDAGFGGCNFLEDCGVVYGNAPIQLRRNHQKLLVQGIVAAIADSCPVHVETAGFFAVQVVEERTASEVIGSLALNVGAQCFKQGVAGRDPFPARVLVQHLLGKDDILVVFTEPSELRFQFSADGDQVAWQASHAIYVIAAPTLGESDAGALAGLLEKIFYDFWHQASFPGFFRLTDNCRQVQVLLCQTFQRGIGDLLKAFFIDFLYDTVENDLLGLVTGIHIPQHTFQFV